MSIFCNLSFYFRFLAPSVFLLCKTLKLSRVLVSNVMYIPVTGDRSMIVVESRVPEVLSSRDLATGIDGILDEGRVDSD